MTIKNLRPSFLSRAIMIVIITIGYGRIIAQKKLNMGYGSVIASSHQERAAELNRILHGYPRNHDYEVISNPLIPSYRLYTRAKLVEKCYPRHLESLLDIGCCRGFYVLDAALRTSCKVAVGIDIHEPFIAIAEAARQYLTVPNASFHHTTLQDVASNPALYGGPFQTVLCIGTYHYMYWGSALNPHAYYSHRTILERIDSICTDRCILSARLELDRLPPDIRQTAERHPEKHRYTTEEFLRSAEELFHVSIHGFLSKYMLFVLTKKIGSGQPCSGTVSPSSPV